MSDLVNAWTMQPVDATLTAHCAVNVRATWAGPLVHLCPFADEVDSGNVEISWTTAGATVELHALAAWLETFADRRMLHEDITEEIRAKLAACPRLDRIEVITRWETAGGRVVVRSAVPGERLIATGA